MHHTQSNLIEIKEKIKAKIHELSLSEYDPKIIAVSKTFSEEDILPLIDYGHYEFGENKVQEALNKWSPIKKRNKNLKLHMLGKLQSNKVKNAVEIFDYIHSLDSLKLANKLSDEIQTFGSKAYISFGYNTWNFYISYRLLPFFNSEANNSNALPIKFTPIKIGLIFYLL